jgi:hypothetical protein
VDAQLADELNDHMMCYDLRDVSPLLVRAGLMPCDIRCFRHKLGFNIFAVCRSAEPTASDSRRSK